MRYGVLTGVALLALSAVSSFYTFAPSPITPATLRCSLCLAASACALLGLRNGNRLVALSVAASGLVLAFLDAFCQGW